MNSITLAPTHRSAKFAGDAYLRFQIAPQTSAVLSMRHIQEVLMLPVRRLTPIPNMPAPLLGLTNRRSRVVWVVDLAQLLGLARLDGNVQQYSMILLQVGPVPLGLVIQQIEGTMRIPPGSIQSPIGQPTTNLVPYLRGCIFHQHSANLPPEVLLLLDAEAIVQSPVLVMGQAN